MSQEAQAEQRRLCELSLHTLIQHGTPDVCNQAQVQLEQINASTIPYVTAQELEEGYNNHTKAEEAINCALNLGPSTSLVPQWQTHSIEPIQRKQCCKLP